MSTYLLNRAVLNRNALDDDQRKAMFARLGGHGGGTSYGGSASKAADAAYKRRSAKAARMGVDLALGMIGGVGIAGEAKAATPLAKTVGNILRQARARLTGAPANGMVHPELNALNELSAGAKALKDKATQEHGFVDEATSGALRTLRAEENSIRMGVSKADQVADDLWAHSAPAEGGTDPFATAVRDARARVAARLRADRAALQKPASVAESSGRYAPSVQARRDAMAAELRRDRELKRLDLHPELFFGNRMPPARSDEERQRRAYFARMGGSKATSARGLLDQAGTLRRQATSAASASVVGPNDRNPQPANGFLDWALQEQRPGGPVIQPNPRNPYDTPEARAAQLVQQYSATLPPHVNPNPPGGHPQPMPRPQRVQSINDAASLVAYFRRQFPAGGDLLGAREIEALQSNPDDAGSLQNLHNLVRQTLERGTWTNDTTALPLVEQARRSGIGKALAILHSNGLMTEYFAYSRRSDGAPNFSRNQRTEPTWGGMIAKPPPGRVMPMPGQGTRTPSPSPAPSPTPPRQRPTPPGGPSMPIGGPAPIRGEPGTRPIARIPEQRDSQLDPGQRIGGPAPVRRSPTQPISTPKATASAVQRAVGQFRTW